MKEDHWDAAERKIDMAKSSSELHAIYKKVKRAFSLLNKGLYAELNFDELKELTEIDEYMEIS